MIEEDAVQHGVAVSSALDDCIGATFEGEHEAVVFVPASGDVLLCGADAWRNLNAWFSEEKSASTPALSPDAQPLVATLRHIGVSVG